MLTRIELPFNCLFLIVSSQFIVVFTFSTADNCFGSVYYAHGILELARQKIGRQERLFFFFQGNIWAFNFIWIIEGDVLLKELLSINILIIIIMSNGCNGEKS